MFWLKRLSLGAWGLKMTKRLIISLQIEFYTNQSVFRFKHGCPWQHALTSEFLEVLLGCKNTAVSLWSEASQVWGMSASFLHTEGLYWLLFKHHICPSCLKEKYFSKTGYGEFSVWEHLLEEKTSVLLLVNKPKAYYSVLKSVGFFPTKTSSIL